MLQQEQALFTPPCLLHFWESSSAQAVQHQYRATEHEQQQQSSSAVAPRQPTTSESSFFNTEQPQAASVACIGGDRFFIGKKNEAIGKG